MKFIPKVGDEAETSILQFEIGYVGMRMSAYL